MKRSLLRSMTSLPLAALIAGCGLHTGDVESQTLSLEGQQLAEDAAEAKGTIASANALTATSTLVLSRGQRTLLSAVNAQSRVGQFLSPDGCVTTAATANVVTYTFNQCAGPWGIQLLSGTEIATFSPGPEADSLAISMHSEGMTLNRASIQHHADVLVSFDGDAKRIAWQGGYTGVTGRGRAIEHTADLVWVKDASGCTTTNGMAETTLGLGGLSMRFIDFQRCRTESDCPTGELAVTRKGRDLSVTLAFDGTAEMVATSRNGAEQTLSIDCQAD